jgi:hypothetical protein
VQIEDPVRLATDRFRLGRRIGDDTEPLHGGAGAAGCYPGTNAMQVGARARIQNASNDWAGRSFAAALSCSIMIDD